MAERTPRGEPEAWLEIAAYAWWPTCIAFPYNPGSPYGKLTWRGQRHAQAHVVVCELRYGPCPPGMEAAHWCGNKRCVNWRHLRWATPSENMMDKRGHGSAAIGERNGQAKLTWAAVAEIRTALATGETQRSIAERYGVSQPLIGYIHRREAWI